MSPDLPTVIRTARPNQSSSKYTNHWSWICVY